MNTGGRRVLPPAGRVHRSTPEVRQHAKKYGGNTGGTPGAYIATASPGHLNDLAAKVEKARNIRGTKVIIVLIPCLPGWGADNAAVKTARLAWTQGCFRFVKWRTASTTH